MISYEVSIGFILIGVVLFADSFNMNEIVKAQQGHGLGIVNAFGFNLLLFPLAVMFLISSLAETARAPFDLTEAESELVAGYQTRSEEHTSELQSLMRISYDVFCLKTKNITQADQQ